MTMSIGHSVEFENAVQNNAATKIQSFWREHRDRQLNKLKTESQIRNKAARIIQNAVRCWFCKRWKQYELTLWDKIPLNRRIKINEKMEMWRQDKIEKLKVRENSKKIQNKVQQLLDLWHTQASEREDREKRLDLLCSQVEATSLILEGSKSLADFRPADIGFYWCQSTQLALEARRRFKQSLWTLKENTRGTQKEQKE